jgi:membrane fusion protein (multidrug efflux system)
MKKSTKATSIIIIFFLIIATVIIGRNMMGKHFEKKFSKRPPPELIVTTVKNYNFSQKLESFGTALPIKTKSFRLKKSELLTPIKFNQEVKKDDIIANLTSGNIIAPFSGVLGKRGLSDDVLVSESSIILTLDDSTIIFSDIKIPETYATLIRKGLPIEATFSGYKNKIYNGEVDSVASRINAETRSLLVRIKITNDNSELIPGALLEVTIRYNEKNSLGVPDTAVLLEGSKKYVYKVLENNTIEKIEIETGIRNKGNLEVVSGLQRDDTIVAEGLGKTSPGEKIKPIINEN